MKKAKLFLLVLLLPALIQVSCKKDDDTPETPTYREPTAASRTEIVSIPAGLEAKAESTDDIGADLAVFYMGLANALSGFSTSFAVPEGATIQGKKNGSTVYFWTYGGYSSWMTYTELSDKYTWKYEYEFPNHPRFTWISAEEAKNGKSGSWTIFNQETPSEFLWTYDWSVSLVNVFTASLVLNDGSSESSFDVVSGPDNSGSFKYYIASVLKADIIWMGNGSGTYWIDSQPDISGSWTAN